MDTLLFLLAVACVFAVIGGYVWSETRARPGDEDAAEGPRYAARKKGPAFRRRSRRGFTSKSDPSFKAAGGAPPESKP